MQNTLANPSINRATINIVTIGFQMKVSSSFETDQLLTTQCRSLKNAPNYRDYASKQYRVSPSELIDDEGDERKASNTTQRMRGSHETQ